MSFKSPTPTLKMRSMNTKSKNAETKNGVTQNIILGYSPSSASRPSSLRSPPADDPTLVFVGSEAFLAAFTNAVVKSRA